MVLSDDRNTVFESVYAKYADMMYRIALTHIGEREAAEDAVHDVFINYIQANRKPIGEEHEKAWFIRATINRCHDLARRRAVRSYVSFDELGDIPDHTDIPEENGILRLVSALPEKYKSVILLHCLEEFSVEKTASILGISVSAAKMRLSRGRDMLKELMNKEGLNVQ